MPPIHQLRFRPMTILILLVAWLLSLGGCTKEMVSETPAAAPTSAAAPGVGQLIDIKDASPAQCGSGGKVYVVYVDINHNSLFDSEDVTQSTQVVCNGQNGAAGADGHGLSFMVAAANAATCAAGGGVILMATDLIGDGIYRAGAPNQRSLTICNGVDGANGVAGVNGRDGTNGRDGATPAYAPVEPILPCGTTVAYKEVLLRLANGQVLASFSDSASGAMTRLTFLPDGTYMDTDNSSCTFHLATSVDGHSRSMSWFGATQVTWAMPD